MRRAERRSAARPGARSSAAGFTLIEVLIAFTVAVILLLPMLRSFSQGLDSAARSDNVTEATLIAESTLEAAGANTHLVDGDAAQNEGRYRIATAVHRYGGESLAPQPMIAAVIPYEIVVTVSWQEMARSRSVALRTLRLAPPPPGEAR